MPDPACSSAPASRSSSDAPQVVLVHGAWHGAWCWDAVRDALVARGIPVAVVELPLRGLAGDAAVVRDALDGAADGAVVVDPDAAAGLFYADSTPEAAAAAIARLRPMHAGAFGSADAEPAWRSVASTYVVCTADRALPPPLQREMARRAGAVRELDTDHSPFLTRPDDVAALVAACRPAPPA